MSASYVFIGSFVLYLVFLLWLGWYSVKKEAMSAAQYFQAGKSTGKIVFIFGTLASIFSSWMFMGNPALFPAHGLAAGGWLIQVPLIGFCIYFFWNREYLLCNKYGFNTASSLLGDFYESKLVKLLVALLACLYCIPYIATQMKGAGAMVSSLSNGALGPQWGSIIIAFVTLVYMVLGGMRGTAWTAAFQGFILITGFYGLGIFIFKEIEFLDIWQNLLNRPGFMTMPGPNGGWNWTYTLTYALVCSFGIVVSPVYTIWIASCSKGFAKLSQTTSWVAWTLICGFTYMVTMFIIGCGGFALLPDITQYDSLVPLIMVNYFPLAIYCLVGVAAIAAAQSTAASSLQAATSAVVEDIMIGLLGKRPTDKQKLLWGRICTIVFLLVAMAATNQFKAMIAILGSLGVSFGFMLLPAWFGAMFWPWLSKAGVSAGIITGSSTLIFLYVTASPLNKIMHFGFWGFVVNVVVCLIVSSFTQLPSIEKVRQFHGYLKEKLVPEGSEFNV